MNHRKYLKCFSFIFLISLCFTFAINSPSFSSKLIIPSQEDILTSGYPSNENGETYGPNVKEAIDSPDLLLAQNGDLLGYIRSSDLDDGVKSLSDALSSKPLKKNIPMYLQDGTTVIGYFTIGE